MVGVGQPASARSHVADPGAGSTIGSLLATAAAVATMTAAAAGCAPAADSPAPNPTVPAGPSAISWRACGERLECSQVQVPLDWGEPRGRQISLSVIRHPASKPAQRIGSLFVNPGGPGESGVGLVKGAGDDLDTWGGGRFDVVSWDPRGTNASTPVRCFTSPAAAEQFWRGAVIPTTAAESTISENRTAELARRCGEVSGWLLPHISTADTARDLDYLRSLVSDPQLNYVGLSYGTYLGQTYANLFPGHVRAMVLDGVVDPVSYSDSAETRVTGSLAGTDEVFNQFLSLCQQAGSARCALAGESQTAPEAVAELFTGVRSAPVPAPSATPPGELDYGDLLLSQFQTLRDPRTWPANAAALNAAIGGNGSELEMAARPFRSVAGWTGSTTSAAIQCADAPAQQGLQSWPRVIDSFDRVSYLQGRMQGWWLWAPCAAWPVRGQDNYRGPWNAATPNPLLLIGTRYDPNTAYANAVRAQRLLGNSVLLTHQGYGHISFQDPSACVDAVRTTYLTDLVVPAPGTVCQSDGQPFATDFH